MAFELTKVFTTEDMPKALRERYHKNELIVQGNYSYYPICVGETDYLVESWGDTEYDTLMVAIENWLRQQGAVDGDNVLIEHSW
jgi:hypothetical protein